MSKLSVLSGSGLIKALEKLGYAKIRQRGSHVRLIHLSNPQRKPISVPLHKEIGKGLLRKILRDANLTPRDLEKLV